MSRLLLTSLAAAAAFGLTNAHAYATFSGVDANGAEVALATTPNSTAAEASFKSNLQGVGTENFETRSGSAPLTLDFGIAGTATLNGGGSVASVSPGSTNGFGRYSVPGGSRYWEVEAGGGGTFEIDFSQEIAAFGFYGIDIGDFSGTLQLQLFDDTDTLIQAVNVPAAAQNQANASVLYFGLIAQDDSQLFKSIKFVSTTGSGDVFAFDSFTIGSKEQVVSVPEPASLGLVGAALLGLGLARRRRG